MSRARRMAYDAFISYSHAADGRLATALQRGLHRFAKPWWKARAVRVFRDETSLALAHSLPDTLARALEASGHFILMASPVAARSKWVAGECEWWVGRKDPARMLMVLSEGEIVWDDAAGDFDWAKTNALPPVLKGVFRQEPLFLDLRWAKDGASISERDPRFLEAVAKISAALRGMSLDQIAGEDVRQHRGTRRVAAAAVSAIALLAAGAAAGAWIATENAREAERQRAAAEERRREAERQRERAEKALEQAIVAADTLAVEIADGLKDFASVPVERRRKLLAEAEALFGKLSAFGDTTHLRHRRAVMLTVFADAYMKLGNLAEARSRAEASREQMVQLVREFPSRTDFERSLSLSHSSAGVVLQAQGDLDGALASFRAALAIGNKLAALDPRNTRWQQDLSASHRNIGAVLRAQGERAGALASYRAALAINEKLAAVEPHNTEWQRNLSLSHGNICDLLLTQGDLAGARASCRAALAVNEALAAADPHNTQWQRGVSVSHKRVGDVLIAQSDYAAALASYRAALTIAEKLAALDPQNALWQSDLSLSHGKVGDGLWLRGDRAGALASYRAMQAIAERLAARDPHNTQWQRDLAISHSKIGDMLRIQGNLDGAMESHRAALASAEKLAALDPRNTGWQHDLFVATLSVGLVAEAQQDGPAARAAYARAKAIIDELAARDPANERWRRDRAWVGTRLAALDAAVGK